VPEPHDISDSSPDCYSFDVLDFTDNLEMHRAIAGWLSFGSNLPHMCEAAGFGLIKDP